MSDLPDYRREIVIVESVELDIVGSATVDITHVGGVAIATPTVTACVPVSIENDTIAYDGVNDRFTIDIEKWSATDTVNVEIQNATIAVTQSGSWTVAISGTVTVTGTVAATQSGTWNIGTLTTITNTVTVAGTVAVSGTVTVAGTVAISGTVAVTQSGTWNIATLTGITNNVNVDIVAQTMGNVDVNLAAQAADIDVNVTNASLTITGSVTVSSGAVTISTSGGINIVIDKMTQTATGTRARWQTNYQGSKASTLNLLYARGTVFPRGMRGMIYQLAVYMYNASGGAIDLNWKIMPTIDHEPIRSGTISIPDGTNGYIDLIKAYTTTVKGFYWDYDSLVVKIQGTANLDVGTNTLCYPSFVEYGGAIYTEGNIMVYLGMDCTGIGDVTIHGQVRLSDRSDYTPANVTADTLVKTGIGRLHTITINSCGTGGVITIYDNTAESGTTIAAITLAANTPPVTLHYDVRFTTGLYVGFDASVVADLTVSYI